MLRSGEERLIGWVPCTGAAFGVHVSS